MGRQKKVVCEKCMRLMRQDNLNRHMRQHEEEKLEQSTVSSNNSLNKDYETGSEFSSISSYGAWKSSLNRENIIKTLEIDAAEYKRKLELVRILYKEAKEREIPEESLRREYKEAKELYIKHRMNIDLENVILRPWQESLLQYIKPTNREIIWVIGKKGNEGKTWFQDYMESKFGWSKVIAGMDIKLKKSSICHALTKRSLMTTDIFLFDVGKAQSDDAVNYELIEKIKNGRVLASKFDSKELKFHTPNAVVVFSNEKPDVKQLSKDRWKIFNIKDDDLIDATDKYI